MLLSEFFQFCPKNERMTFTLCSYILYLCVKKSFDWLKSISTTFKKAINLCRLNSSSMYIAARPFYFFSQQPSISAETELYYTESPTHAESTYIYTNACGVIEVEVGRKARGTVYALVQEFHQNRKQKVKKGSSSICHRLTD